MMRRETAYRLAGRKHAHGAVDVSLLIRERELRFKPLPAGQADQAFVTLARVPGLRVAHGPDSLTLIISYSVLEHTLRDIEDALLAGGYRLENSLLIRLKRALAHYSEQTQRHNLLSPQRLLKQPQVYVQSRVYVASYEQHPHGNHDDTPPELREYK